MELEGRWTEGHTQPIFCLDVSASGQVASGGEDGEFCLWDGHGILTYKRNFHRGSDVNSVCFTPGQPDILYVSSGSDIEMLDVRCPQSSMARYTFNQDDINQLAIDPKEAFLAACDDDGAIKIIDVRSRKCCRTLKGHNNICSSVSFHPNAPRELASGGLDCLVNTWEITRRQPLVRVNMQEVMSGSELGMYAINPPFVHSVDHSSDGELLACGLENSRIEVLERMGKRSLQPKLTLEGHRLGVTQVCFLPDRAGQVNYLLSAGNDCMLMLWDTDRPKMVEDTDQPKNTPKNDQTPKSQDVRCRIETRHENKINWITPTVTSSGRDLVLVADTTKNISVYKWQLCTY